jgi:hypothetical protein
MEMAQADAHLEMKIDMHGSRRPPKNEELSQPIGWTKEDEASSQENPHEHHQT